MNRLFVYVSNELRALLKQWPTVLILYVILPLAFMMIMSFSMSEVKDPSSVKYEIDVTVNNLDEGPLGKLFVQSIKEGPFKDVIHIKEDEDIQIEIPKKFSQQPEIEAMKLSTTGNFSQSELRFLENYMKEWHQSILEEKEWSRLASENSTINIDDVKQDLQNKYIQLTEHLFVRKKIQHEKFVSNKIYYLVIAIIYGFIIAMSSSTAYITKDEYKGVYKRLEMMPLSHSQKHWYSLVSVVCYLTITSLLILLIAKFGLRVDSENEWHLIPWIIVYAAFFAALGNLLLSSMSKQLVQIMIQIIMMIYLFLGVIPLGDLLGGSFGNMIKINFLEQYLIQPMTHVLIDKTPENSLVILICVITLTIIINSISIWNSHRKERA